MTTPKDQERAKRVRITYDRSRQKFEQLHTKGAADFGANIARSSSRGPGKQSFSTRAFQ